MLQMRCTFTQALIRVCNVRILYWRLSSLHLIYESVLMKTNFWSIFENCLVSRSWSNISSVWAIGVSYADILYRIFPHLNRLMSYSLVARSSKGDTWKGGRLGIFSFGSTYILWSISSSGGSPSGKSFLNSFQYFRINLFNGSFQRSGSFWIFWSSMFSMFTFF